MHKSMKAELRALRVERLFANTSGATYEIPHSAIAKDIILTLTALEKSKKSASPKRLAKPKYNARFETARIVCKTTE